MAEAGGTWRELAPAKVNLTLHVTGRRGDGYHLLDSLVVFPAVGDLIEAEPATGLSLSLGGPFGADLHSGADNLVMRAAELLRPEGVGPGAALHLVKSLPVASGIGGGSSDAAATLRLLARFWGRPLPGRSALAGLGADVPVCLFPRSSRMRGIGELIEPVDLPPFWTVLVNPGLPLATGTVFSGLASRDNAPMPDLPPMSSTDDLFDFLAAQRNDLEAPARREQPHIEVVIDAIAAVRGCALARMSGSGATCFGLFARDREALSAAEALRHAHPGWWVVAAPVG